jgi:hypothetical protein
VAELENDGLLDAAADREEEPEVDGLFEMDDDSDPVVDDDGEELGDLD